MKRIGHIYGLRLKGDIELGQEPIRKFGSGDPRLSRIMAPGRRLITEQQPWEASDSKKYELGSRLVMDERVFHYALVVSGGRDCEYGLGMATTVTTVEATIVSGTITKYTAVVTLAADVEEDDYKGGYFGLKTAVAVTTWGCRIVGNTAATAGNDVTLTLEAPLPVTITAADTATITAGPWSSVIRPTETANVCTHSFVGVIGLFGAAPGVDREGQYIWLQTWGPFPEPQISYDNMGAENFERMLYFKGGGDMQCCTPDDGKVPDSTKFAGAFQPAGWYMPDSTGGDLTHPVVWLTIAP